MMRRTTVLIADDHVIVSEGLAALLTKHDFEVVGTVRDGHALIDAAKRLRPEVIVTDHGTVANGSYARSRWRWQNSRLIRRFG